ncbi:ankyrin repeat domain-containing protein [Parashewanella tropica]|uniref:ankyrin repeat domain-containing protein n=1 Tax=Parashewanella tropica TaxID=2547970 RepID=UPI0010593334|nr:ankyrin repeat domain-containing protein [Parashewanella tropica]
MATASGDTSGLVEKTVWITAAAESFKAHHGKKISVRLKDDSLLEFDCEKRKGRYVAEEFHQQDSESTAMLERSQISKNFIITQLNKGDNFLKAVASGDINNVKTFIEQGIDINCTNKHGETALHLACRAGNVELVKLLLAQRADVNFCDKYNTTPLMCAVGSKHLGTVQLLLKSENIDVNARNNRKTTAFSLSCSLRHTGIAGALVANNADVNLGPEGDDCASRNFRNLVIIDLFSHQNSPSFQDFVTESNHELLIAYLKYEAQYLSAVLYALVITQQVGFNNAEKVRILVEHKHAQTFPVSEPGQTPLVNMILRGNKNIVMFRALLKCEMAADKVYRDSRSYSFFNYFLRGYDSALDAPLLNEMLTYGSDLQKLFYTSTFWTGSRTRSVDDIKALANCHSVTLIVKFVESCPWLQQPEQMEIIVDVALSRLSTRLIERLVKDFQAAKDELDKPGKAGNTRLHRACTAGNAPMVKKLLAAGADTTITNNTGKTPFQLARKQDVIAVIDRNSIQVTELDGEEQDWMDVKKL